MKQKKDLKLGPRFEVHRPLKISVKRDGQHSADGHYQLNTEILSKICRILFLKKIDWRFDSFTMNTAEDSAHKRGFVTFMEGGK